MISSPLSRESAILANSVLLLIVTATVLAGTLFPLALEVFTGEKISVGAPYFNKVIVPIMVALIFLLGIGPSVPWRKISAARFLRNFRLPLIVAVLAGAVTLALTSVGLVTFVAILAVAFAAWATLGDIGNAIRARRQVMRQGWLRAVRDVFVQSRQRIGALIVHLGIVLIAAGMIASGLFQSAQTVAMRVGDWVEAGGYTITLRDVVDSDGPNYDARMARFSLSREGELIGGMSPEKRFYPVREMATTEVAIHSVFAGDVYIVMGDEPGDGSLIVRIFWNPLVAWIWLGWMVILLGALLSLSMPGRRVLRRRSVAPIEGTPAE